MMTLNQLASAIAHAEGKKHQASIGDIREILKILVLMDSIAINRNRQGPAETIRLAAINKNRRGLRGGGSCAKRGEAKVSKEDKIKGRRDGKAKRTGRTAGRKDAKARKRRGIKDRA